MGTFKRLPRAAILLPPCSPCSPGSRWPPRRPGQPFFLVLSHYAVHTPLHPHYHGSGSRPSSAIREGDWKLVEWLEAGRVELYNLARDLGERHDLAASEPATAARLKARLDAWRTDVRARMPARR